MNAIAHLFDGNFAYAFAWTMVHSLWQCSLIALALAVSLRVTRSHSPALRHIQSVCALVVCAGVSTMTFFHYYNDIGIAASTVRALGPGVGLSYAGTLWEQFYVGLNNSVHYLVLIWTVGFAFQCYRYTGDFFRALRLKTRGCENVGPAWRARFDRLAERIGLTKPVTVRNSHHVGGTCVIGHFKPVILVPVGLLASLSADQVEAIILHELAHIKRHDYLLNALQCFVRLLYFFNPAVLWISSRIDIERENACDDIAVQYCGSAAVYARSLALVSEMEQTGAGMLAANGNRYQILPRIKRLFAASSGVSKAMEKLISAVCVSFVVLAMNVSAEPLNLLKTAPVESEPVGVDAGTPAQPQQKPAQPQQQSAPPRASSTEPQRDDAALIAVHDDRQSPETEATPGGREPGKVLKASPDMDFAVRSVAMNDPAKTARPADPPRIAQADPDTGAANTAPDTGSKSFLEPMHTPEFDQFFVASNANIPLTRKIHVGQPQAEFAEIWLRRFRGSTGSSYREMILKDYGQRLADELTEMLERSGWTIVETASPDSLRLSIRLFDLYIFAPEAIGLKQTIIPTAGQAGVELEFLTPDGRPFMKILDYRQTKDAAGSPFVANRATNFHYFAMLMDDWAQDTGLYLKNIMSIVEQQKGG